jgi:hypothetical protein
MMTPQEILAKHGIAYLATRKGKFTTKCPNCGGGYLNVEEKKDSVVWYCPSCQKGGGEKYEQRGRGKGNGKDLGKPTAVYDYHDENGKRLFQVLKFEPLNAPKTFLQRTNPNQKKWSIKGVRRVLYRLPELIAAISAEHVVFVVEGEKDVETLRKHNVPATTNPMGATTEEKQAKGSGWIDSYTETLRGADVVLCGDNDPQGREHVRIVAEKLHGIAKRVRVLELARLWSDIDESDDITDWFARGAGTVERLWEIVEQAPDYTPEKPSEVLPFRRHGEKAPLDDRTWAVENLIPEVGTGVIAGQWGTLKTFVALELAHCMMTTRPFIGFDIVRPGGVLLLALEGQSEVAIRIQGALENKGADYHKGAPFYWCETCPPLADSKTAKVIIATAKAAAAEFKQRFNLPLSLILIDSLVAAAGYSKEGQDNDAALTHAIMMVAAQVSRAIGCFVFVIDHYGKDTNVGTRGSSVKEGDADVIFACLGDRSEGGKVSNSRLALRKRRAGPSGEEFPFKGRLVEMGLNTKTNKMETTLVIEWEDAGQASAPKKDDWGRGKAVKLLRRIIMSLLVDCGEEIKPFADGPMVRTLKLDLVAAEFFKHYVTTGEDDKAKKHAKRTAFKRALDDAGDKITGREIGGVDYIWLSQPGEATHAAE